jgi:pimeloyl-ACP methyl ester carboxylesterase
MLPETRYAKSGDVHIAYQVVGDGPLDLVSIPPMATHIELAWEDPTFARFLRRLAAFSRLLHFDKRGVGLSDRVPDLPTLEQRMDDVRAVMDAAGAGRAALFGGSEGGSMSALFAATYPERTVALVLLGAFARRVWAPDYPWAPTWEERQRFFDWIEASWGRAPDVSTVVPGRADDEPFQQWKAKYQRQAASPGGGGRAAADELADRHPPRPAGDPRPHAGAAPRGRPGRGRG